MLVGLDARRVTDRHEQHGFAPRHDVRERVKQLSAREIHHGCRRPSASRDSNESRPRSDHEVTIVSPAAACHRAEVRKRDYGTALERNLRDFPVLPECHPLPVRGDERIGRTLRPRELPHRPIVQPADEQPRRSA